MTVNNRGVGNGSPNFLNGEVRWIAPRHALGATHELGVQTYAGGDDAVAKQPCSTACAVGDDASGLLDQEQAPPGPRVPIGG